MHTENDIFLVLNEIKVSKQVCFFSCVVGNLAAAGAPVRNEAVGKLAYPIFRGFQ